MTDNTRVPGQYRSKPKAVNWYNITPEMADQIFIAAEQVRKTWDIETQEGVQLDIIGEILRASRGTLSDDSDYVLFLRSAIVRNNGDATIDSILEGLEYIVDGEVEFIIDDFEDMSFGIEIDGNLSNDVRDLIFQTDIVQRPQGVWLRGTLNPADLTPFGPVSSSCGNTASAFAGFLSN